MSKSITIGTTSAGKLLCLDVPNLIDSRMLIQGNSGAGKSRLLRRIAEEAHGTVQMVVLDPEGEFSTLRESFDFLLVGKGGEIPAAPHAAPLLARRLMELRVSAIVDLYDLRLPERRSFVRQFLDALLALPKDLYRPLIVAIDEAHLFCPERSAGEAESTDAVIALLSQGRKRGFCGIPLTQRLSKLHKDAAAECNNVAIGRTWLDVDQKRAGQVLGMALAEQQQLRELAAGEFMAFGPAFSESGVVRFVGADVQTTHPTAGQRHKLEPPAPSDRIRALLSELKDLPQQAADEIKTLQAAQQRIRELERTLKAQPKPAPAPAPASSKTRDVPVLKHAQVKRLEAQVHSLGVLLQAGANRMDKLGQGIGRTRDEILAALKAARREGEPLPAIQSRPIAPRATARAAIPRPAPRPELPRHTASQKSGNGDGRLGGPERKLLTILAQHPEGRTVRQLAVQAGYRQDGGGFRNPLGRIRSLGYVEPGDPVRITETGRSILGDFEELPTGTALLDWWLGRGRLSGPEKKILRALAEPEPQSLSIEALAERTGYDANGGGFRNPLGRLRTLELVTRGPIVRLCEELIG